MKRSRTCKVYWSLALLCYLEVLLWIFCVVSPVVASGYAVAGPDLHYLATEQANLQSAIYKLAQVEIPQVDFELASLYFEESHKSWQRIREDLEETTSRDTSTHSGPRLPHFQVELTGIPAPYTGISAID